MRPCCEMKELRRPGPAPGRETPELHEDETLEHCICGAHHYELSVDPLEITYTVSPIG